MKLFIKPSLRVVEIPVCRASSSIRTFQPKNASSGIVYATKPLSYQGELIENFSVRFENGKAVEVKAEKNQVLLEPMISMDEGASYLEN